MVAAFRTIGARTDGRCYGNRGFTRAGRHIKEPSARLNISRIGTRRNSFNPRPGFGKNCNPSWHTTASKAPSANGSASPSAATGKNACSFNRRRALSSIAGAMLRAGGRTGICVISTPDRAPMWGLLADVLGRLLPEQRPIVQLYFSLADPARLENLLVSAGFQEVCVERQIREGSFDSFDEYWEPIEAGIGSIPQIYLTLPDAARRAVRQELRTKLAEFETGGRLRMSVEMLIGTGRA